MASSSGLDDANARRCGEIAGLLRRARPVVAGYSDADPNWEGATNSQLATERLSARRTGGEPLEIALGQAISIAQLYIFAILQHLDALSVLFESDPPPVYTRSASSRGRLSKSARAPGGSPSLA